MKHCEQCWDPLQGRQQENSNSAENMTHGILYSWLILFQTQCWLFPAIPSAKITEVNGKVPTITENTVMSFQQLTSNIIYLC